MSNIYYNPEKFGLKVVAEIELTDEPYMFDTRVVWQNENGELFTARDSGCSCPTPFEQYKSVADLDRVFESDLIWLEKVMGVNIRAIRDLFNEQHKKENNNHEHMQDLRQRSQARAESDERWDGMGSYIL